MNIMHTISNADLENLSILVDSIQPPTILQHPNPTLLFPSCMSATLDDEHCCSESVLKCETKSLRRSRLQNAFLTEYKVVCDNSSTFGQKSHGKYS